MAGLDEVTAAHTRLSHVDGQAGRLILRGLDLHEAAGRLSFEALTHRLFQDLFADLPAAEVLARRLGLARARVFAEVAALDARLTAMEPVDAVRALTARLDDGHDLDTALDLLAAPAVFTPALARLKAGLAPLAPDPALGHAADVLRMTKGEGADATTAAALDAYLVTVSDHGLNASTFAARVAASTGAGLTSAMLAGISTLKGPLHGGAPGPVIHMLDAVGQADNARPWVEAALDRGERLMGFGHRIYRVRDPRADALKAALARLGPGAGRLALAEALETAALAALAARKPERPLQTNVEFYTALLLETLGFTPDAFTAVFAMGRTAGWIAHAREQALHGRLIRPQSAYIGPWPQNAEAEADAA